MSAPYFAAKAIDANEQRNAGMVIGFGQTRITNAPPAGAGDVNVGQRQDIGDPTFTKNLRNYIYVTTSYSVLNKDEIVGVRTAGSTITLPEPVGYGEGRILTIKDESGGAESSNITINARAGSTVDGASSVALSTNYGVLEIYVADGNWYSISEGSPSGGGGGADVDYAAKGVSYAATADDDVIGCTAGGITITLPDASTVDAGKRITVKDVAGLAGGSPITVDTDGGDIDGETSTTIDVDYGSSVFVSDGTDWFTL